MATLDTLSQAKRTTSAQASVGASGLATTPAMVSETKQFSSDLQALKGLDTGAKQIATAMLQGSQAADNIRSNDLYALSVQGAKNIDKTMSEVELKQGHPLTSSQLDDTIEWKRQYLTDLVATNIDPNDKTNIMYKEKFLRPATENMQTQNKATRSKYWTAFKEEKVLDNTKEIKANGSYMLQGRIDEIISDWENLKVANANENVYAALASSIITDMNEHEVESWDFTDKEQTVDFFTNGHVVYKDGEFSKGSEDMSDAAFNAVVSKVNERMKTSESLYNTESTQYMSTKLITNDEYIDREGNLYTHMVDPTKYENEIDSKYPDVGAQQRQKLMDMFFSANSKKSVAQSIYRFNDKYDDIVKKLNNGIAVGDTELKGLQAMGIVFSEHPNVADTNKDTILKKLKEVNNKTVALRSGTKLLADSMISGSMKAIKSATQTASVVPTKEGSTVLETKVMTQIVKTYSDKIDVEVGNINIDEEANGSNVGIAKLESGIKQLTKLQTILIDKPDVFKQWDKLYNSTSMEYGSVSEAKRALYYNKIRRENGDKKLGWVTSFEGELIDILNSEPVIEGGAKKEGKEKEEAILNSFNARINKIRNDIYSPAMHRQSVGVISEGIDLKTSGADAWLTILDTDAATNMGNSMHQKATDAGVTIKGKSALLEFTKDQQTIHVGQYYPALTSRKDIVVLVPDNIDVTAYDRAIAKAVSNYNELHTTTYDSGSIDVKSYYSKEVDPITGVPINDYVSIIRTKEGAEMSVLYPSTVSVLNKGVDVTRGKYKNPALEMKKSGLFLGD